MLLPISQVGWEYGKLHSLDLWAGHSGWSFALQEHHNWQATVVDKIWGIDITDPWFLPAAESGLREGT